MIYRTISLTFAIMAFLLATVLPTLAQDTAAAPAAPGKVKARYDRIWLPDASTAVAQEIDDLFNLILIITGVVFVLVFAVMIYFLIRYRQRSGHKAIYNHGNTKLEIIWTVIPAIIVVALGFLSRSVWADLKQRAPSEASALVIDLKPRQFQWDITYPGSDGKHGTPDDIVTINQLHVPAAKDVLLNMTAQDVIHSFFVPELRNKQDAVPGMVTKMWFNVPKPGNFEIACAELCGLGHYRMRGYLTVHDPAAFDAWYTKQKQEKAAELAPPPAPAADTSTVPASPPADTSKAPASAADTSKAPATPATN